MTPPHSKKGLKQQQQQQQHSISSVTKGSKESLVWLMDVVFVVVNVCSEVVHGRLCIIPVANVYFSSNIYLSGGFFFQLHLIPNNLVELVGNLCFWVGQH